MDRLCRIAVLLIGLCLPSLCGCKPKPKSETKSASPAKVELLPHESELATITLTEDADKRLGIETVDLSVERLQRHRTFGGEVLLPPGKVIQVTAPVGGQLVAIDGSTFPTGGQKVKAGQTLFVLRPLLSPERNVPTSAEQFQMIGARATLVAAQVTAQGDIERSTADLTAAQINVARTQKLLSDRAGSQRAVDDATALLKVAEANLSAARKRFEELTNLIKSLGDHQTDPRQAETLEIKSPIDGLIRTVNSSANQPVVSGAVLFELIDMSSIWVRVPVFVDLLSTLSADKDAQIVRLDGATFETAAGRIKVNARPIAAPPSADPTSASADVYYELTENTVALRPGQRVGVSIPLAEEIEAAIVPTSAILYDYHGGTWIYTKIADRKYKRERVNVLWFEDNRAVIDNRLAASLKVVSVGAAELFGTEFGPGK